MGYATWMSQASRQSHQEKLLQTLRRTSVNSYFLLCSLVLMSSVDRKVKYHLQLQDDSPQVSQGGTSWSFSSLCWVGWTTEFSSFQKAFSWVFISKLPKENTMKRQILKSIVASKQLFLHWGESPGLPDWKEERVAFRRMSPFHGHLLKFWVPPPLVVTFSLTVLLILKDRKPSLMASTAGCCCLQHTCVPSIIVSPIRLSLSKRPQVYCHAQVAGTSKTTEGPISMQTHKGLY